MRRSTVLLWGLLVACGAAQKPAPARPRFDFDDAIVQRACQCNPPRLLAAHERLGARTVAEQRQLWSRSFQGELRWHAQAWFEVPAAPTQLRLTLLAKDAYEVSCTKDSLELGCFAGAVLRAQLTLQSDDGALDSRFEIELRFRPEAVIVQQQVQTPALLLARRKNMSTPPLTLSLIFDGKGYGQLYVEASETPGETAAHPVAKWELNCGPGE